MNSTWFSHLGPPSRAYWNIEMLVFYEAGNQEYLEKDPRNQARIRDSKILKLLMRPS